ncbi:protocadherin-10-like [Chiloscyllium plagiosum]|uniref:protocadherin-10-like n=1 Tax=Chiloscyllium plagiosum TaxID=36176 RepID=UPI001CB82693|nr:protocadherin-10-like [Chiloscyllium plagiosum]
MTMATILMSRVSIVFLLCISVLVSEQLRYSIPEEVERGTYVGNVADDLGLKVWELPTRKFLLISDYSKQYMEINVENGFLFVNERIDREQLCSKTAACYLSFQITLDNPLEMFPVEVEILDVNDNSPVFSRKEFYLQINELNAPGARFPLESARDLDVGTNTINTYQINPNEHFIIKVQTRRGGNKNVELVLKRSLDREKQSTFTLVLTAIDGGIPQRSGTARIIINVIDTNDNAPVFDHETYRATVMENIANGSLVLRVHAADIDEGTNADVTYSFTNHVSQTIRELFKLDPMTGEIRVRGVLDFEEANVYEFDVQAMNSAPSELSGLANVVIDVLDTNDNRPVLQVTVVSSAVREDASSGVGIALISVTDRDSGEYGTVQCQIPDSIPFKIERSLKGNYKLITNGFLDHEITPLYNISISAWDGGFPPLSASKFVVVSVIDVNDNSPSFTQSSYKAYLMENNAPGTSIFAVSANDADLNQNAEISYSIVDNRQQEEIPSSAYFTINSKNGNIYALRSFDYEQQKHFQVKVQAQDAGSPPLSSTAFVNVIILDQNDNAPIIVSPLTWNNSATVEVMPRSTYPGYLVTKVIATDEDSGQNARLSYEFLEATDPSLFTDGLLSGEIRATRAFSDQDIFAVRVVLCVKDNGQPSLSSSATISFLVMSNVTEKSFEQRDEPRHSKFFSGINSYLIIIFGTTSFLFLIIILFLLTLKCRQDRNTAEVYSSAVCCCNGRNSTDGFNRTPTGRDPLNYSGEVQTGSYHYSVCLSPESSKSDFLFLKPCHPTLPFNDRSVRDSNAIN